MRFETEAEIAQEAGFIRNVELWPMWPWLPVKNYRNATGGPDVGMMHSSDLHKVYVVSMFDLKDANLETVPTEVFDSVEDLIKAGWMGD